VILTKFQRHSEAQRSEGSVYTTATSPEPLNRSLVRHTLVYNRFLAGHMTSVSIGFSSDRFNELSDVVLSSHTLHTRCATNRYFQVLGNIHDIESYFGIDNVASLTTQIVTSHYGHTSIILLWISGNLFHVGWMGNYELFSANPISTIPIGHAIFDPHFGLPLSKSTAIATTIAYSGIYNSLYTLGFTSVAHIYNLVITGELLALISIVYAALSLHRHHHKYHAIGLRSAQPSLLIPRFQIEIIRLYKKLNATHPTPPSPILLGQERLDLLGVAGFLSIGWSGHLSAPARPPYSSLTFFGGLKPDTMSLYLTDIAHHHLAVGILFVLFSHLYSSLNGSSLDSQRLAYTILKRSGLNKSLDLQLSLACAVAGYVASVVSQHTYSLLPYQYLCYHYVTTLALYVHHQYIASFLMMAVLSHATIYLIRDYTVTTPAKHAYTVNSPETSHSSWISLYLGFHSLCVYIHNDTVVAFGSSSKQILIEPVFASIIQESSSSIMPLGPGDLIVHHAIALGLHVTVLILSKASLHARGSHLMPDKINFALSFACDGPTRGGTCDISAWDSLYLAFFWMLNTDAWIMFYFHWKHLSLWLHESAVSQFDESSTYLNGWFRDYLWFNSAPLVNGYNAFGANDLSVLSWIFLAAHLCWATGFMFLISWRGYWQELIDIILVMHLKTPILYDLWNGGVYTPVALSIVQARFIGLFHFSVGFIATYAAFVIGSTS
jgi:photosystem I P700 chlorophyll a apoprotein A2